MFDKMKETLKEFISNMNPESLEKTRKRMEDAIRKEAIEKAAKEYAKSKHTDTLLQDIVADDFNAGAEFMYEWITREYIVIREVDVQEILGHRIKDGRNEPV